MRLKGNCKPSPQFDTHITHNLLYLTLVPLRLFWGLAFVVLVTSLGNDNTKEHHVTVDSDGQVHHGMDHDDDQTIPTDFGVAQSIKIAKDNQQQQQDDDKGTTKKTSTITSQDIMRIVQESNNYMNRVVRVEEKYAPVRSTCVNRDASCSLWAAQGRCNDDDASMTTTTTVQQKMRLRCAPACQSCEALLFEHRCPWTPTNETNAWKEPGDLNAMFQRIVTDPYFTQFHPTILSQPPQDEEEEEDRPWIVTLDNFLTEQECQHMRNYGETKGYRPSLDIGHDQESDGTYRSVQSSKRTSSTAWCWLACYDDPLHQSVLAKLQHLTSIPEVHYGYLQLLKYTKGQFYGPHHDYFPHTIHREEGVRILTVFLYLNDVEEGGGGGTRFPLYNITVQPRAGRVLVWPNVLNDEPHLIDDRTIHQALPVEGKNNIKYGANAWIHLRQYKNVFHKGCASTR